MISDDLSALFAPAAQGLTQAFAVVLGQAISFNAANGTNSIAVGGTTIPNVPLVSGSVDVRPGDTVLLGRIGNGYVIIGALILPGGNRYGAANSPGFWEYFGASNFGGPGTVVSVTFTAPSWANSFSAQIMGTIAIHNNTAGLSNLSAHARVQWTDPTLAPLPGNQDIPGQTCSIATPATYFNSCFPNFIVGGNVAPGAGITTSLYLDSAWPVDAAAAAQINVQMHYNAFSQ